MERSPPDSVVVSSLESHVGYWLRFVSNHVSHAFKLKVEAHGVTVAEWVVLRALFDINGINPSQLAEKIGLTRGAVSKLIDRLVKKGFVLCRAGKTDRRYQTVSLSVSGRKLVPVLAALADDNDREFFGHLDKEHQAELTAALQKIVHRHGLKSVPVD
jgi:DNA-binding MarR family transcriptional regulator